MLSKDKEKASESVIVLNLKPPYHAEVVAKPYPVRICDSSIKKFDGRRINM